MMARIVIPFARQKRPCDWASVFPDEAPLEVEIGSGQGEYLLDAAGTLPRVNRVGVECDWERVRRTCGRAARLSPEAQERVVRSVRVLPVDVWTAFERMFRDRSVARMICLFPCPWPKDRHIHHRLFSGEFLRLVNARLQDGGELVIVTDYGPYADWIAEEYDQAETGLRLVRGMTPPRFATKFEAKWRAAGQDAFFQLVLTKERHLSVPLKEDAGVKAFYHDDFCPERFTVEETRGDLAVIMKDFLYDSARNHAMVRLMVAEPHLTQPVWVTIIRTEKGWCVLKAKGQQIVPSDGVARAIELVSEGVARSAATKQTEGNGVHA